MTKRINNFRIDFYGEFTPEEVDEAMNMAQGLIHHCAPEGYFPHQCGMDNGLYGGCRILKAPTLEVTGHYGEIVSVTRA